MKSDKSYNKFQKFHEIVLPVIGLSALFYWDGDIEIKIVLTIILMRVCFNWSELAELKRGFNYHFKELSERTSIEVKDMERPLGDGDVDSAAFSWGQIIGEILQIVVTIAASIGIALLLHKL
jgi:hypothetical protein